MIAVENERPRDVVHALSRIACDAFRGAKRLLIHLVIATLLYTNSLSAAPAGTWLDGLAELLSARVHELDARRDALGKELATLAIPGGQSGSELGYHAHLSPSIAAEKWVQVDLGEVQTFDTVVLIAPRATFADDFELSYGFPLRFRIEAANEPEFDNPRMLTDHTHADFPRPGVYPVILRTPGASGRLVRVTTTLLPQHRGLGLFALGELMVLRGPSNLAFERPVTSLDSVENLPDWSRKNLVDGRLPIGLPLGRRPSPGNGYHSQIALKPDETKWVQVDLGEPRDLDEIRLVPAHPRDFPDRYGFGFPIRFRVEISDDPACTTSTMLADRTEQDIPNPGNNLVTIAAAGNRGRYVRVTATGLWQRTGDYVFALSELQAISGGRNVALGAAVTALDSIEPPTSWGRRYLVDGFASQYQLLDYPPWLSELDQRRVDERELTQLDAERQQAADEVATRSIRFGGAALIAIALTLGGTAWRSRRRRRQELEQLRDRIARDLHDEIGSNLGSIALLSQLGAAGSDADARRELGHINEVARETAESMRDIVWLFSGDASQPAQLAARFRETAANLLATTPYDFTAGDDAWPPDASVDFKRQTLLIFKESLHNISRHSQASQVKIAVRREQRDFHLQITDDGIGFDPASASAGTGLRSMRSRAQSLGGRLDVTSQPGQGTTIELVVPRH